MDRLWFFSLKHDDWKRRHFLLWLGFYVVFTLVITKYGPLSTYLLLNLINVIIFALAYYLLRYWQIPFLYQKRKYISFSFSLVVLGMMTYGLYWFLRIFVVNQLTSFNSESSFKYLEEYLIRVLRFYSPAIALLVWEFQFDKKREMTRVQLLEREKLSSELQFLKAQINPHFLFNTLNNIYSFVVNESPGASDMIDRLSGILDYALNKSQATKVSLKDEIKALNNYLELEQIRYGDRLEVNCHTSGDLSVPISPLIILSIIENAFKHGASGDINNPKITIDIQSKEEKVTCIVWNTKTAHKGEINDAYKSGIGLSNIKRQLLLIYPNAHTLHITDSDDDFTVDLTIKYAA